METDAEPDVTDTQMMQIEESIEVMDADTDVTDSQMMQVEEPMEGTDWGQDEETDDLLCRALDREMERQRRLDMYGGGRPPAQVQPPQPAHAQPPQAPLPPTAWKTLLKTKEALKPSSTKSICAPER